MFLNVPWARLQRRSKVEGARPRHTSLDSRDSASKTLNSRSFFIISLFVDSCFRLAIATGRAAGRTAFDKQRSPTIGWRWLWTSNEAGISDGAGASEGAAVFPFRCFLFNIFIFFIFKFKLKKIYLYIFLILKFIYFKNINNNPRERARAAREGNEKMLKTLIFAPKTAKNCQKPPTRRRHIVTLHPEADIQRDGRNNRKGLSEWRKGIIGTPYKGLSEWP